MGTLYRNNRPYGASIEKVPTKTSDLENDSGYITQNDIPPIPTKVSDLRNDKLYQTESEVLETISPLEEEINSISPKLEQEISDRQTSDSNLEQLITSETNNRINADNSLQEYVDNIQSLINDLQSKLDNLKSLVPSQASEDNQLADKEFVNSSIATNTSNFIGTFNTLEELESQSATNNDYAFWKTTDSDNNVVFKRYKYVSDDSTWQYEYDLNNSSFTSEQWATINSGVTKESIQTMNDNIDSVDDKVDDLNTELSQKITDEETQRIQSDKNIKVAESDIPKHIKFTNSENVSIDIPIGGDTDSKEITQNEYDQLTEEEKNSDTIYFIKDSNGFDIDNIDDDYIRDVTTWSSNKINNELDEKNDVVNIQQDTDNVFDDDTTVFVKSDSDTNVKNIFVKKIIGLFDYIKNKIIKDDTTSSATSWSSEKISSTLNNYASVNQVLLKSGGEMSGDITLLEGRDIISKSNNNEGGMDITWLYSNNQEKCRIWTDGELDSGTELLNFRSYKKDGTLLQNTYLDTVKARNDTIGTYVYTPVTYTGGTGWLGGSAGSSIAWEDFVRVLYNTFRNNSYWREFAFDYAWTSNKVIILPNGNKFDTNGYSTLRWRGWAYPTDWGALAVEMTQGFRSQGTYPAGTSIKIFCSYNGGATLTSQMSVHSS